MKLPTYYSRLAPAERIEVRERYIAKQNNKCMYCNNHLDDPPPKGITEKYINWDLFPPNFLRSPVHLQHDHGTDLTEGAVHAYCNAVLWFYEGK